MLNLLAQNSDGLTLDVGEAARDVLPYAETVVDEGPGASAANLISGLLEIAMLIAGILVLFYLVWGAIEWITAGGDQSKIEGARTKITQSIVGILVLSATVAIFNLLQTFLNVTLIDFGLIGGGSNSSSDNSGDTTSGCPCGSGGYAQEGARGALSYPDGPCYLCQDGNWVSLGEDAECGIISCN